MQPKYAKVIRDLAKKQNLPDWVTIQDSIQRDQLAFPSADLKHIYVDLNAFENAPNTLQSVLKHEIVHARGAVHGDGSPYIQYAVRKDLKQSSTMIGCYSHSNINDCSIDFPIRQVWRIDFPSCFSGVAQSYPCPVNHRTCRSPQTPRNLDFPRFQIWNLVRSALSHREISLLTSPNLESNPSTLEGLEIDSKPTNNHHFRGAREIHPVKSTLNPQIIPKS